MDQLQSYEQFLATYEVQIPIWSFVVNLLLAFLFSYLLGLLYVRYGKSLSNRKSLANNFVLIAGTTMLIITIVKSSLALSLGLVGALSIVRFRAAIKEPEELAYIFLVIALGLGMGADQRLITIVGFGLIAGIIFLRSFRKVETIDKTLQLTIQTESPEAFSLDQMVGTLKEYCSDISLKRVEENKNFLEAAFLAEFEDFDQLRQAKNALRLMDENLQISILEQKNLIV